MMVRERKTRYLMNHPRDRSKALVQAYACLIFASLLGLKLRDGCYFRFCRGQGPCGFTGGMLEGGQKSLAVSAIHYIPRGLAVNSVSRTSSGEGRAPIGGPGRALHKATGIDRHRSRVAQNLPWACRRGASPLWDANLGRGPTRRQAVAFARGPQLPAFGNFWFSIATVVHYPFGGFPRVEGDC